MTTPEPTCGEPMRFRGFALLCDRPHGHLPPDEHASTVHWKAPVVRANARKLDSLGIPGHRA